MDTLLHPERRVLVMTSVAAERDAVLRGLDKAAGFDVRVAGVGLAAAAASTAAALASDTYDLVINVGIAGGFVGRADVGSLVVADEIVAADLGAQTPDGFISVDELGFGSARVPVDLVLAKRLAAVLGGAGLPVTTGAVLSVSTVTGTAATAAELSARIPGAAAEAMEGYGVAIAAQQSSVPMLELRAISNPVGPRDRTAWRMKEALQALQTASSLLPEVVR